MLMMTGRLPLNFAGGGVSQPEIERPSNDFQRINSGSEKSSVLTQPVSLNVHRSSFPVFVSNEYASDPRLESRKLNPRSLLFLCHPRPTIIPIGTSGFARSRPVSVFRRCKTSRPSSLDTNAIILPSHESRKLITSHWISLDR